MYVLRINGLYDLSVNIIFTSPVFHGVVFQTTIWVCHFQYKIFKVSVASSYFELQKKKKVVGLERVSLSLVSTTEELHDKKVAAPV
jgi:hypothetical protein